MSGFVKRAVAVVAGVVLGMAIVAGSGPWRELLKKSDTTTPAPAPVPRERAPDTRV